MPHDRKSVDALLATATSRMLNAGYLLNRMRELHRLGQSDEYWRAARDLAEHLSVGGGAVSEAHRILLSYLPVFVPPQEGGLPN